MNKETVTRAPLCVFDLHCDTLDRLALFGESSSDWAVDLNEGLTASHMASLSSNGCHISLERTAGYLWCQCLAVFIPDEYRGAAAWSLFERVQAYFTRELDKHSDRLAQVRMMTDVQAAFDARKLAGMLTIEGAGFLEDDSTAEARLDALTAAGVRMVTLTWNGPNALGSGNDTIDGLTGFGRAAVRELEQRGIVVDVSHLNDAGFRDVCACAERPFAASHSNARAVCNHPRNLADWQLREIAERGGIVGFNYCNHFLSELHDDPTRDDVLRHVDHILEVAGERVLALGSDFDGCDPPSWLVPCDKVDNLYALLAREFGVDIAGQVFFHNAHDFFARAEAC